MFANVTATECGADVSDDGSWIVRPGVLTVVVDGAEVVAVLSGAAVVAVLSGAAPAGAVPLVAVLPAPDASPAGGTGADTADVGSVLGAGLSRSSAERATAPTSARRSTS